jgi:hypothetical protein
MAKKDEDSKRMLQQLGENPGYQALKEMEGRGLVQLGKPTAQPKALKPHVRVRMQTTSSRDPSVSEKLSPLPGRVTR